MARSVCTEYCASRSKPGKGTGSIARERRISRGQTPWWESCAILPIEELFEEYNSHESSVAIVKMTRLERSGPTGQEITDFSHLMCKLSFQRVDTPQEGDSLMQETVMRKLLDVRVMSVYSRSRGERILAHGALQMRLRLKDSMMMMMMMMKCLGRFLR